jgi:hypothetical protein
LVDANVKGKLNPNKSFPDSGKTGIGDFYNHSHLPFKALVGGDEGCMKQLTKREEKKMRRKGKRMKQKILCFGT